MLAASEKNLAQISTYLGVQTIGYDKLNQLRHTTYFKDKASIKSHMKILADFIGRKFDITLSSLSKLEGLGIAEWTNPKGGYFISFDTLPGCAKAVGAACKKAGVMMTKAGATWPYGRDPYDTNIRIAPSYPPIEDLKIAAGLFALCVKMVSAKKILEDKKAEQGGSAQ
jgi:DNA-binding transcriptional MocR family regulator